MASVSFARCDFGKSDAPFILDKESSFHPGYEKIMNGHGGARPGAGRRKGSINRATLEARTAAAQNGQMPLDYMLAVMRDSEADQRRRDDMAKAAAPYLHARLSAVELAPPWHQPENVQIDVHFVQPRGYTVPRPPAREAS